MTTDSAVPTEMSLNLHLDFLRSYIQIIMRLSFNLSKGVYIIQASNLSKRFQQSRHHRGVFTFPLDVLKTLLGKLPLLYLTFELDFTGFQTGLQVSRRFWNDKC